MRKIWGISLVLFVLLTVNVMAHVTNEKTIYDDIDFSQAKEEIVYLRGINAVPHEVGANIFRPNELLKRSDLAFWAGTFAGLGNDDSTPEDIQNAAVSEGLIDSLDGNATYGDVNQAYFAGNAPVEDASQELSREQFALYMGQFFRTPVNGETLFDRVGYAAGPSGLVDSVKTESVTEGDSTYDVFSLSIDGVDYQVSHHPKLLFAPTDLALLQGKTIEESWIADGELNIIKVSDGQFTDDEIGQAAGDHHGTDAQGEDESDNTLPIVLIAGGVVLVVIIAWLFLRRKK